MPDRRYGRRPTPPLLSDHWLYAFRSTGEPGVTGIRCPRCGTASELELTRDELPLIGGQPQTMQVSCSACSLLGVIVINPPLATRPPATFLRNPTPRSSTGSTQPATPPMAERSSMADVDELLLTLGQWQQLGIAPEDMHPASPAAVHRHADERPGRRNPEGLRLYSHSEILAADIRQHTNNHTNTTPNTNDSATQEASHG
ncbi:MAG: hypothetical protein ACK5XN_23500 [Bacteroidota bacterium]